MLNLSDIEIDHELRDLLPALSADEREELRESIDSDGWRDPIIVWLNYNILVDGHNRLDLWRTEFGADEDDGPAIVQKFFASREDVVLWIIRNQLARRNLTDAQRVAVALKLKPALAAVAFKQQAAGVCLNSDKGAKPIDTTAEIAKVAGVSKDTVRKVESVQANGSPELIGAMKAGAVSINAAAKAAKLEPAKQVEVVQAAQVSKQAAAQAVNEATENGDLPTSKQRMRPLNWREVITTRTTIERAVNTLLNRVKKTSTEALHELPRIALALHEAAEQLGELSDQVDEKLKSHGRPPSSSVDWSVTDDIGRFRQMIDKMEPVWSKADRSTMRQFFEQMAKDVSSNEEGQL